MPEIVRIEDAGDPQVADYVNIREAELVLKRGIFLVEGAETLRTMVSRSRFPLRSLFLCESRLTPLGDVLDRLPDKVPVYVARRSVMEAIAGFNLHRGCLGVGDRTEEPSAWKILDDCDGPSTLLVLESLTDHTNIGAIFRSAAAFGVDAVLLDPKCADPLYRKSIRVSIGASLIVPFGRLEPWPGSIAKLVEHGFACYALTPRSDATPLDALIGARAVPERVALFLGTEGAGLSEEALQTCTERLRIPISNVVDSLNVATASSIALYALRVARSFSRPEV